MESDLKLQKQPRAGRWQVLAVTGLVLACLLVATVGVLIYIALNPGVTCSMTNEVQHTVDVEEIIQMKNVHSTEFEEIDENLKYYSKENIAILTREDGSFNLQDYDKGLHVTKDLNTGICYVVPNNMSSHEGRELEKYLHTGNSTFNLEESNIDVNIIPGTITDTKFIPDMAHDHCSNGYQWLTTSPATRDGHQIVKRRERVIIIIIICCRCRCSRGAN